MKAVILTIMGASLAITGCASLSKAECELPPPKGRGFLNLSIPSFLTLH